MGSREVLVGPLQCCVGGVVLAVSFGLSMALWGMVDRCMSLLLRCECVLLSFVCVSYCVVYSLFVCAASVAQYGDV